MPSQTVSSQIMPSSNAQSALPTAGAPAKPLSASARKMRLLKTLLCTDKRERALRRNGANLIAGVDEVGRGALFGPVVAAAVILPANMRKLAAAGLKDSKQLVEQDRERIADLIYATAIAISIAEVDAATIDAINIYQASRRAMHFAVLELKHESAPLRPDHLLIDAMRLDIDCAQTSLIYGDSLSLSIAAASVVAKVYRDRLMRQLDADYPQYGLPSHKGYGTPQHLTALREHGPCPLHRRSFAPVSTCLAPVVTCFAPATPSVHIEPVLFDEELLEAPADAATLDDLDDTDAPLT